MINNVIIGVSLTMLAASLITVIPESLMQRNSAFGRIFRFVRIRLREMSRTAFCVTGIILLFVGSFTSIDIKTILIVMGILLVALIILHPEDFLSMFRTRRKAAKKHEIAEIRKTGLYKGRTPLASQLTELTPLAADEKVKG